MEKKKPALIMKKTKILYVIRTLLRAGAERMLVNTCNELLKRPGFEVAIYTVNPGNEFQDILDPRVIVKGGDVSFHFSFYRKNRFDNSNYIQFVNEFGPDIIHSHLYYGDLLIHSYHYPQAKYFTHQHNSEVQEYDGFNFKKILQKRMWSDYYEFSWLKNKFRKHDTKFIACSAGTQSMLKRKFGFGRIYTLPNAIPLPKLINNHKTLNPLCLNIIWVGRLSDAKRPQLALQVAKELRARNLNFKFKIVGKGIHFNNCLRLIQEFQLEKYVEMTGMIDDMTSIYSNGELMLHTAVYEGLPMVFIEANSYGVPIISSDCMPNNEILQDGKNGYIIHSDEPKDYADKIEKIFNSHALYEKLSQGSIETSKQFGIQAYVDSLIEIYNKEL
jgi:glycosyltransferase involved in cell wall biosynthesis